VVDGVKAERRNEGETKHDEQVQDHFTILPVQQKAPPDRSSGAAAFGRNLRRHDCLE
jgi:hypothetical protein